MSRKFDDDPDWRLMLSEYLKREGSEVSVVQLARLRAKIEPDTKRPRY